MNSRNSKTWSSLTDVYAHKVLKESFAGPTEQSPGAQKYSPNTEQSMRGPEMANQNNEEVDSPDERREVEIGTNIKSRIDVISKFLEQIKNRVQDSNYWMLSRNAVKDIEALANELITMHNAQEMEEEVEEVEEEVAPQPGMAVVTGAPQSTTASTQTQGGAPVKIQDPVTRTLVDIDTFKKNHANAAAQYAQALKTGHPKAPQYGQLVANYQAALNNLNATKKPI